MTPHDAADLARLELGTSTSFPIDVYVADSEELYRFELDASPDPPKKPPAPAKPIDKPRRKEKA